MGSARREAGLMEVPTTPIVSALALVDLSQVKASVECLPEQMCGEESQKRETWRLVCAFLYGNGC
jgi:hypothetical protein